MLNSEFLASFETLEDFRNSGSVCPGAQVARLHGGCSF